MLSNYMRLIVYIIWYYYILHDIVYNKLILPILLKISMSNNRWSWWIKDWRSVRRSFFERAIVKVLSFVSRFESCRLRREELRRAPPISHLLSTCVPRIVSTWNPVEINDWPPQESGAYLAGSIAAVENAAAAVAGSHVRDQIWRRRWRLEAARSNKYIADWRIYSAEYSRLESQMEIVGCG